MALLDELHSQSASLKPLMPPVQIYKDFIVSYQIDYLNISISSYWQLAINKLRQEISNIDKFRILQSGKKKFSFIISARLVDKKELKQFVDALYNISNIGGSSWYNHEDVNLQVQRCHEKFIIKNTYKPYDEIYKVIFEDNDNE